MSRVRNLQNEPEDWEAGATRVTMMNLERKGGKQKPVIKKALVWSWRIKYSKYMNKNGTSGLSDIF